MKSIAGRVLPQDLNSKNPKLLVTSSYSSRGSYSLIEFESNITSAQFFSHRWITSQFLDHQLPFSHRWITSQFLNHQIPFFLTDGSPGNFWIAKFRFFSQMDHQVISGSPTKFRDAIFQAANSVKFELQFQGWIP